MAGLASMAAVLLVARGAAADPDPYPELVVDRPLVYAPGMTAVDIGLDAPTYRYGAATNTRLGEYVNPDLVLTHAFDGLELSARFVDDVLGGFVQAGGGGYLGPGVLWLDVGVRIPSSTSGLDSERMQVVAYHLKTVVVPHVLSVDGGAAFNIYEISRSDVISLSPVSLGVSGGAALQLEPEFSVAVSGGAYVPVADTTYAHTSLFAGATLRYVVDRFDLYGWARLDELQAMPPVPSVGGGVITRFGR